MKLFIFHKTTYRYLNCKSGIGIELSEERNDILRIGFVIRTDSVVARDVPFQKGGTVHEYST
jgi:hypothetical protein